MKRIPLFSGFLPWCLAASLLPLGLAGCPSATSAQLQSAAQASDNAAVIVRGLETAEISAHQQGLIPDADHQFIQTEILALAQLGKTTDACIGTAGSAAGAVTCLQTAATTVSQIQAEGATRLKSPQAQQDFNIALTGMKTVLDSLAVVLQPAPSTPSTTSSTAPVK